MTDRSNPRSLRLLSATTAIGSTGLAAGGTAGALLAADLTGSDATAGLPLGTLAVGAAVMAVVVSRLTYRTGRARGLAAGYGTGVLGALVVAAGAVAGSLPLVLAGSFLLGGANAGVFLARYAAADVGRPHARGRSLGAVLSATAFGAVAGPNLLDPAGRVATAVGLPPLAGPYLVAAAAFLVAGFAVARLGGSGRRLALAGSMRLAGALARAVRIGRARLALLVMAAGSLIMVGVMAVAPLAMTHHRHGLGLVGLAVGVHVLSMFGPSPLTGRLADRVGGGVVAGTGMVLLAVAGLAGRAVDLGSGWQATALLVVLGLGWNGAVVGGSVLLVAGVPAEIRPHGEALGEAAMGLAGAVGAPAAGLIVAVGGFPALGAIAATVAVLALLAIPAGRRRAADPGVPEGRLAEVVECR